MYALILFLFSLTLFAAPSSYTELLPYVQIAPNQAWSNACLYMASTGAVELLANKKNGIKYPRRYGPYDLAETWLVHAPDLASQGKSGLESVVYRFNAGYGVSAGDWPFDSEHVWDWQDSAEMTKVPVPKVQTIRLFDWEARWATNVLTRTHIQQIKDALVHHHSPVLVNYNEQGYWHVVLIVGYDDNKWGKCYQITSDECDETEGAFYVRDSFGHGPELRDYDWFKIKGSAAYVIKEQEPHAFAKN